MGFSNINHYHGWTAHPSLDHLLLYGVGASNMFPCFVAKTPWGNGWMVGGCHILPHYVWWIWMNLGLGRTELIFSVEKLQNAAVVSLAFSIKLTSSAKNRLRFCLFPFHAKKFSICLRWIQIHLFQTALVFGPPRCTWYAAPPWSKFRSGFHPPTWPHENSPGWIWPSPGQAGRWLDENGRREIPEVWCSQGDFTTVESVEFFGAGKLHGRWNCKNYPPFNSHSLPTTSFQGLC